MFTSDAGPASPVDRGGGPTFAARHGPGRGKYAECINYMPWMRNARATGPLLVAQRQRRGAGEVKPLLAFVLGQYRATDPDPSSGPATFCAWSAWAAEQAARRARQFRWVQHPELDRVRCCERVERRTVRRDARVGSAIPARLTIHVLPTKTWKEWTSDISVILRASGDMTWPRRWPSHWRRAFTDARRPARAWPKESVRCAIRPDVEGLQADDSGVTCCAER